VQSSTMFTDARTMKSVAMVARAAEFEELLTDAKEKVEASGKSIEELGKSEEDLDKTIKVWLEGEKTKLSNSSKKLGTVLTKVGNTFSKYKDEATKRQAAELKELTTKAMAVIRAHQASKDLDPEGMFKEFTSGDVIDASDFTAFFEKNQKEDPLSEEDLGRAFSVLDDEDEGGLSKDRVRVLLRVLQKVVNDVVMTDNQVIKESKVLRRMELGEVLEFLANPVKEGELLRVKARAVKDDITGWVTIQGNQGTAYLKEGGGEYKVIKETLLTESFEIGAAPKDVKKKTSRKLKVGEVMLVREWDKKDETTGLTRMKIKTKSDGLVGYVTTMGNTGIKFVEAC